MGLQWVMHAKLISVGYDLENITETGLAVPAGVA